MGQAQSVPDIAKSPEQPQVLSSKRVKLVLSQVQTVASLPSTVVPVGHSQPSAAEFSTVSPAQAQAPSSTTIQAEGQAQELLAPAVVPVGQAQVEEVAATSSPGHSHAVPAVFIAIAALSQLQVVAVVPSSVESVGHTQLSPVASAIFSPVFVQLSITQAFNSAKVVATQSVAEAPAKVKLTAPDKAATVAKGATSDMMLDSAAPVPYVKVTAVIDVLASKAAPIATTSA